MNDDFYYTKYLKYKSKYLNLIKQTGGVVTCTRDDGKGDYAKSGVNKTGKYEVCCNKDEKNVCENAYYEKPTVTTESIYKALEERAKKKLNPTPATPR